MNNKFILIILSIIIFLSECACIKNKSEITTIKEGNMQLTSINFKNGENLPEKFSCHGEGKAPQLSWNNFPKKTKSFVLTLEDPDAPAGTFVHWIIINIPPDVTEIAEGSTALVEGTPIINDSGQSDYFPPCPPSGTHRYIFKIYALNTETVQGVTKNNFYNIIKPYIIDYAQLESKYGK